MQTFLPFADYVRSAKSLDRMRLGKQRVEAWQILRANTGQSKGWTNHPASKMWHGHEKALCLYGLAMCMEWQARGYQDTLAAKFLDTLTSLSGDNSPPPWFGNESLHLSHQSNLVRKMPAHYGPQFPGVPDNLPYVWPVLS